MKISSSCAIIVCDNPFDRGTEMKILAVIKKILYSGAFAFTVTVFAFIGMLSVANDDPIKAETLMIPTERYPWILLFSLIVGALNNLLTSKALPLGARLSIHATGVLGSFYFIILRVFGLGQNGSGRLSVMLVAAIIYAVTLAISYFVRSAFIKKANLNK